MPKQFTQKQKKDLLNKFLLKNKLQLIKQIDPQNLDNLKVTVFPDSEEYLPILGDMLRNGKLVGFPTETVYGLGADATNQQALLDIYRVKRRPLTDPIIVHVLDYDSAAKLVVLESEKDQKIFKKLSQKFWPGPLTMIMKANLNILPLVVTAQTGYVGLRSPLSPFARKLIKQTNRPIGAPSANLFSHVSPTSAVHVVNDFYDQDIAVVDGPQCEFGVQSTVVKIVNGDLEVLREGSLSVARLREFVEKQMGEVVKVQIKKRVQKEEEGKNMEAPGQLLKHYAPYLPCYSTDLESVNKSQQFKVRDGDEKERSFEQVVFISFSKGFDKFADKFKFYLTPEKLDQKQVEQEENQQDQKFCTLQQKNKMKSLYFLLRKAQNLDASLIIIGWDDEKSGTLWDKIYRSTQGQIASIL